MSGSKHVFTFIGTLSRCRDCAWNDGTRAVEARREARREISLAYRARIILRAQLGVMLAQLGVPLRDTVGEPKWNMTPPVTGTPGVVTPEQARRDNTHTLGRPWPTYATWDEEHLWPARAKDLGGGYWQLTSTAPPVPLWRRLAHWITRQR